VNYRVTLSHTAADDLVALEEWLVAHGGEDVADRYIERVERRIATLDQFPNRGTPHDDLLTGLRSLSFERRPIIYYRVLDTDVEVLRVVGAAQDQRRLFG
jgi:toxin ParE1/3/4